MEAETIKKKKVELSPQTRFKEFQKPWLQLTLGDLLSFKNGLNLDKGRYGSGVKFINVLDIINNDFITHDKIIGSVEVTKNEFEKNSVEYGDILFQRSSETREEVGQANVYIDKENIAVFGGFVIKGKKIRDYNPKFLNYLLKTAAARKEITSKSGGSTRYNVGQDTLKKVIITTTSLPEQQKIAAFLSAVDKKIQQLTRKKALLETYKKGVMQKLFSQEIRFKDYNSSKNGILERDFPEWEEKRLGDVASFSKGKDISKNDILEDGLNPCIRYGELYTHYSEAIDHTISKTNLSKENLVLSEAGDVIIPASGETQIDIATASCVIREGVALGGDLNIMRGDFNGIFLAYYINSYLKNQIARLSQGSSVIHLYSKQLMKLNLWLPTLEEQQKIANFLSAIDKKTEAVSQQIDKMQSFKKGLLQQMFV